MRVEEKKAEWGVFDDILTATGECEVRISVDLKRVKYVKEGRNSFTGLRMDNETVYVLVPFETVDHFWKIAIRK